MRFDALEAKYGHFYAPSFEVTVDNTNLQSAGIGIQSLSVDCALDAAYRFTFSFDSPYDVNKDELQWLESPLLRMGGRVEIKIGYGSTLKSMMIGEISSISPDFPSGGIPRIEVGGYDLSNRMMKGKRSSSWSGATDSEVAKKIASRYGFNTSGVEDTGVKKNKIIQNMESDYDFLSKLAKSNGFEFFIRADNLYFRAPKNDGEESVAFKWGQSPGSFRPELNVSSQVSAVEVRHWDPKTKKEIIGKASTGDEHGRQAGQKSGGDIVESMAGEKVTEIIRKPVYSREEADRLAKAALDKLAEGLVNGSGDCIGIPDIAPGENILLEGLGRKFSTKYYVVKAVHTIDSSGYKTSFNVKGNTI